MGDWFVAQAGSGSLALAIPVALVAGLVSFFSPCVLPLLPGYLSYATGLSGADLVEAGEGGPAHRGRMLAGAVLFVLGFTTVFVILGTVTGGLSDWLFLNQRLLNVVLGVVVIVLGLAFLGQVRWLQRDIRFHRVPAVGLAAAPLLGFLFGLGWTPCVGPTLTVILALAYQNGTASRGGLLMAVYCLGLGLPFIVAALVWRRALGAVQVIRRHQAWVTRIGGVLLIGVGVLLVTGWWEFAVSWLQVHLVSGYTAGV